MKEFGDVGMLSARVRQLLDSEADGGAREIAVALVGVSVTADLERMQEFLGRFKMSIDVVSFEVFELAGGPRLLIRHAAPNAIGALPVAVVEAPFGTALMSSPRRLHRPPATERPAGWRAVGVAAVAGRRSRRSLTAPWETLGGVDERVVLRSGGTVRGRSDLGLGSINSNLRCCQR